MHCAEYHYLRTALISLGTIFKVLSGVVSLSLSSSSLRQRRFAIAFKAAVFLTLLLIR